MAKYRFAKNENGVLFNIEDVTSDIRKANKFFCIGCGHPMRAGLGNKNKHYFAHNNAESERLCNTETYLHKLGKQLFIDLYNKHHKEGTPFLIGTKHPGECEKESCPYGLDKPCSIDFDDLLSLLPKYCHCFEEEWDEHFKPDVLLLDESGSRLYIEIAVTHPCSAEKLDSKIPIIEFHIHSEDDLKVFSDEVLTRADNKQIDFHNISLPLIKVPPNCENSITEAKKKFIEKHQNAVHQGTSLQIPYRIEYSCPHTQCPYLKDTLCPKQTIENWLDLAQKLPFAKDEANPENFSPNVILYNNSETRLRVNFAYQFSTIFSFPDRIKTIQFLVDDILHNESWRIRHYNTKTTGEKICSSTEYILGILYKDGRVQVINEGTLPQIYLTYKNIKQHVIDYVIIDLHSFFTEVRFHDENQSRDYFKTLFYKLLVAFFADMKLPVKNCFICYTHTDNKFKNKYPNKPIYCFAKRMACKSTEAISCDSYDPDINRIDAILSWDFGRWLNAVKEAYYCRRFI
jgi:hypothetical protein